MWYCIGPEGVSPDDLILSTECDNVRGYLHTENG